MFVLYSSDLKNTMLREVEIGFGTLYRCNSNSIPELAGVGSLYSQYLILEVLDNQNIGSATWRIINGTPTLGMGGGRSVEHIAEVLETISLEKVIEAAKAGGFRTKDFLSYLRELSQKDRIKITINQ